MEKRVYLVDVENYDFDTSPLDWDNEKFISESEIQGNVYSIEGFEVAFNINAINMHNMFIRIL